MWLHLQGTRINNSIATVEMPPLFLYTGGNMEDKFYNLLDYCRSMSVSKKLVEQNMLTNDEAQTILKKLKQQYKIQEILDEFEISGL